MKKILLFLFVIPSLAWTIEFNSLPVKPKVLELSKYRLLSDKLELRHIHESPRTVVKINFNTKEMSDFYSKVLNSDINKLYCDGDFALTYDSYGTQYININSIKVCVDEAGFIVAHSIGIAQLAPKEISASTRLIEESRIPAKTDAVVNQNRAAKVITPVVNPKAGFFSPRISEVTTQSK
ncbi:MAG: hypothetical protein H7281_05855 [Bacteriovorax sp.]|nr:hypothetical protein [Bacteriovorax sp.]